MEALAKLPLHDSVAECEKFRISQALEQSNGNKAGAARRLGVHRRLLYVIPAYRSFADFVRTEYAPHGPIPLSVTSLPNGEKRYQNDIYERTTTHMTADEIHQLGLREMDRIEAEMLVIAKNDRSLVNDEAIAYHEGILGYHMQLSIQRQLTGVPKFRQQGLGFTAFVEGWALYAKQLGKEVGFYQDPVSDYGRLSSELLRAVRLVVDTGIHSKGWTRAQIVEFMRKAGVADEPTIQSETDRYIAWPAQALSYRIGQLKFLELRQRGRRELASKFDIRTFNDEMLSGGSMPLDLLETRTELWIAQQRESAGHS